MVSWLCEWRFCLTLLVERARTDIDDRCITWTSSNKCCRCVYFTSVFPDQNGSSRLSVVSDEVLFSFPVVHCHWDYTYVGRLIFWSVLSMLLKSSFPVSVYVFSICKVVSSHFSCNIFPSHWPPNITSNCFRSGSVVSWSGMKWPFLRFDGTSERSWIVSGNFEQAWKT